MNDERQLFAQDEVLAAMALIMPPEEAGAMVAEMYAGVQGDDPKYESHIHLSDDVIDLLSLVSESCAKRVQALLHLTPAEAERRRSASRQRFLLRDRGSEDPS